MKLNFKLSPLRITLLIIAPTILFFITLEVVMVCLSMFNNNSGVFLDRTIERPEFHRRYINSLDEFDQEAFCNFIHKKKKGHILVAQHLRQYLTNTKSKPRLIWAMGGSTTWGEQCKSGTTWPIELQKLFPNDTIINYGKGNMSSDYSVKLLEEKLKDKKPDIILWSHWINEILVHGNERDINYDVLKNSFDLEKVPKKKYAKLLLQRINKTLYKHITFYRMIDNKLMDLANSRTFVDLSFDLFVEHHTVDSKDYFSMPEALIGNDAFKGNRSEWIRYSLENYKINLSKVLNMTQRHQIELIMIFQPFIHDYYKDYSPKMNVFLENNWYSALKKLMIDTSHNNNWTFVDLDNHFQDLRNLNNSTIR